MRLDVVGSAVAFSIFMVLYYTLVGFLVTYFATVFGYSEAQANTIGNWYWTTHVVILIVVGLLSDRLRVRKPFMIIGAPIAAIGSVLIALSATTQPSYSTVVIYFIISSAGVAITAVPWFASFTETVEKHNPAATATGLPSTGGRSVSR